MGVEPTACRLQGDRTADCASLACYCRSVVKVSGTRLLGTKGRIRTCNLAVNSGLRYRCATLV